jgi:S1-C subfamily serine protease
MRALVAIMALAASAALGQPSAEETLSAVVGVSSQIAPSARSAATLGTERRGSGVLIREQYVLTIGYLVMEAQAVEVTSSEGRTVPATVAAFDHISGFGLLKLAAPLGGTPLALGDSAALGENDPAMVISAPGREGASIVRVVSRRGFYGGWEYLLDSAIFTHPAVPEWSGAPLIGPKGELLGIGSLIVADADGQGGGPTPGNMFVPIDLLKPILQDLIASGRRRGPAQRAGLRADDVVLAVAGDEVHTLAEFYSRIWSREAAGVDVPLRVLRGAQVRSVTVRTIDRAQYFKGSTAY